MSCLLLASRINQQVTALQNPRPGRTDISNLIAFWKDIEENRSETVRFITNHKYAKLCHTQILQILTYVEASMLRSSEISSDPGKRAEIKRFLSEAWKTGVEFLKWDGHPIAEKQKTSEKTNGNMNSHPSLLHVSEFQVVLFCRMVESLNTIWKKGVILGPSVDNSVDSEIEATVNYKNLVKNLLSSLEIILSNRLLLITELFNPGWDPKTSAVKDARYATTLAIDDILVQYARLLKIAFQQPMDENAFKTTNFAAKSKKASIMTNEISRILHLTGVTLALTKDSCFDSCRMILDVLVDKYFEGVEHIKAMRSDDDRGGVGKLDEEFVKMSTPAWPNEIEISTVLIRRPYYTVAVAGVLAEYAIRGSNSTILNHSAKVELIDCYTTLWRWFFPKAGFPRLEKKDPTSSAAILVTEEMLCRSLVNLGVAVTVGIDIPVEVHLDINNVPQDTRSFAFWHRLASVYRRCMVSKVCGVLRRKAVGKDDSTNASSNNSNSKIKDSSDAILSLAPLVSESLLCLGRILRRYRKCERECRDFSYAFQYFALGLEISLLSVPKCKKDAKVAQSCMTYFCEEISKVGANNDGKTDNYNGKTDNFTEKAIFAWEQVLQALYFVLSQHIGLPNECRRLGHSNETNPVSSTVQAQLQLTTWCCEHAIAAFLKSFSNFARFEDSSKFSSETDHNVLQLVSQVLLVGGLLARTLEGNEKKSTQNKENTSKEKEYTSTEKNTSSMQKPSKEEKPTLRLVEVLCIKCCDATTGTTGSWTQPTTTPPLQQIHSSLVSVVRTLRALVQGKKGVTSSPNMKSSPSRSALAPCFGSDRSLAYHLIEAKASYLNKNTEDGDQFCRYVLEQIEKEMAAAEKAKSDAEIRKSDAGKDAAALQKHPNSSDAFEAMPHPLLHNLVNCVIGDCQDIRIIDGCIRLTHLALQHFTLDKDTLRLSRLLMRLWGKRNIESLSGPFEDDRTDESDRPRKEVKRMIDRIEEVSNCFLECSGTQWDLLSLTDGTAKEKSGSTDAPQKLLEQDNDDLRDPIDIWIRRIEDYLEERSQFTHSLTSPTSSDLSLERDIERDIKTQSLATMKLFYSNSMFKESAIAGFLALLVDERETNTSNAISKTGDTSKSHTLCHASYETILLVCRALFKAGMVDTLTTDVIVDTSRESSEVLPESSTGGTTSTLPVPIRNQKALSKYQWLRRARLWYRKKVLSCVAGIDECVNLKKAQDVGNPAPSLCSTLSALESRTDIITSLRCEVHSLYFLSAEKRILPTKKESWSNESPFPMDSNESPFHTYQRWDLRSHAFRLCTNVFINSQHLRTSSTANSRLESSSVDTWALQRLLLTLSQLCPFSEALALVHTAWQLWFDEETYPEKYHTEFVQLGCDLYYELARLYNLIGLARWAFHYADAGLSFATRFGAKVWEWKFKKHQYARGIDAADVDHYQVKPYKSAVGKSAVAESDLKSNEGNNILGILAELDFKKSYEADLGLWDAIGEDEICGIKSATSSASRPLSTDDSPPAKKRKIDSSAPSDTGKIETTFPPSKQRKFETTGDDSTPSNRLKNEAISTLLFPQATSEIGTGEINPNLIRSTVRGLRAFLLNGCCAKAKNLARTLVDVVWKLYPQDKEHRNHFLSYLAPYCSSFLSTSLLTETRILEREHLVGLHQRSSAGKALDGTTQLKILLNLPDLIFKHSPERYFRSFRHVMSESEKNLSTMSSSRRFNSANTFHEKRRTVLYLSMADGSYTLTPAILRQRMGAESSSSKDAGLKSVDAGGDDITLYSTIVTYGKNYTVDSQRKKVGNFRAHLQRLDTLLADNKEDCRGTIEAVQSLEIEIAKKDRDAGKAFSLAGSKSISTTNPELANHKIWKRNAEPVKSADAVSFGSTESGTESGNDSMNKNCSKNKIDLNMKNPETESGTEKNKIDLNMKKPGNDSKNKIDLNMKNSETAEMRSQRRKMQRGFWDRRKDYDTQLGNWIKETEEMVQGIFEFPNVKNPVANDDLILFVDSDLHGVPWECFSQLKNFSIRRGVATNIVARSNSTHLTNRNTSASAETAMNASKVITNSEIQAKMTKNNENTTPSNGFFLLNPKGDADVASQKLLPILNYLQWQGCVGKQPNEKRIMQLLQEKDVFLYAGHCGGEDLVKSEELQKGGTRRLLSNKNSKDSKSNSSKDSKSDSQRGTPSSPTKSLKSLSTALLMGCGSAKLFFDEPTKEELEKNRSNGFQNINDSDNAFLLPMKASAQPMATPFHYLIGGAPAVVGTLWDVLGGEIDGFAANFLAIGNGKSVEKSEENPSVSIRSTRINANKSNTIPGLAQPKEKTSLLAQSKETTSLLAQPKETTSLLVPEDTVTPRSSKTQWMGQQSPRFGADIPKGEPPFSKSVQKVQTPDTVPQTAEARFLKELPTALRKARGSVRLPNLTGASVICFAGGDLD